MSIELDDSKRESRLRKLFGGDQDLIDLLNTVIMEEENEDSNSSSKSSSLAMPPPLEEQTKSTRKDSEVTLDGPPMEIENILKTHRDSVVSELADKDDIYRKIRRESSMESVESHGSADVDHLASPNTRAGRKKSAAVGRSNSGVRGSWMSNGSTNVKPYRGSNRRRQRRLSQRVSMMSDSVKRRVSSVVQEVITKEELPQQRAAVARDAIAGFFIVLTITAYVLCSRKDNDYQSPLSLELPTAIVSVLTIYGTSRLSDTSTHGERLLLCFASFVISLVASIFMFLVTSPCAHCAYLSTSSAVENPTFSLLEPQMEWTMWHILLSPNKADDAVVGACRMCVSNMVTLFFMGGFQRYVKKRTGFGSPIYDKFDDHAQEINEKVIEDDSTVDLSAWFLEFNNQTKSNDLHKFNNKLALALEEYGHLGGEALAGALNEYLCSPASRTRGPDPVQYLSSIKHGRFTGENEAMQNLSIPTLQKIMKGQKDLGVSVCFMLRLPLFIEEDHLLESKPLSHELIAPMADEATMKSTDITNEIPGVMMPLIDQDIDPDGSIILRSRKIFGVYTQLPFEDTPIYLDSTAEYLAFYRWELEASVQDDWFFPHWLIDEGYGRDVANLKAKTMKHAWDYLALENPTSDETLSDRSFYGTGQKWLTPLKIPGLSDDYDFQYPLRSDMFMTLYHREKFRYSNKPTSSQLLEMVRNFYPNKVKSKTTLLDFKDKILQIDISNVEAMEVRPQFARGGAILYLDVKTRKLMGIWASARHRLYLPNEGRDWEHAKFMYRVSERQALAGNHVMESHFGWSHAVSTAAWQTLPHDHPLRTFLKPFTMNAHQVNSAAYNMLVQKRCILEHASGMTSKGVLGTLHHVYSVMDFSESIPELLASHGLDEIIDTSKLPMWGQGIRLYNVHREFAENFLSLVYKSDEDMLKDDSLIRFWYHVNTYGRNTDPCVCGMDSDIFFDNKDNKWPASEPYRTCEEILDSVNYEVGRNMITRRRQWCTQADPFDRIKALRALLEKECAEREEPCELNYEIHVMRNDMGMKPLRTIPQLVDFLATAMWHVSAGHNQNGDNIPYLVDPDYAGTRLREYDENGNLPTRIDLATYVFGTTICKCIVSIARYLTGDIFNVWTSD